MLSEEQDQGRKRAVGLMPRRWVTPVVATLIGVAFLIAGVLGDRTEDGLRGLLVMIVVAGVFAWGQRNETVASMTTPDERWRSFDQRAMAVAGLIMAAVAAGMTIVRLAQGRDAGAFAVIAVVGAVSYACALAWNALRS